MTRASLKKDKKIEKVKPSIEGSKSNLEKPFKWRFAESWEGGSKFLMMDKSELRIGVDVQRPSPVKIIVNGKVISAFPGESVAAALFASGIVKLRRSSRFESDRGMFCLMGVCQECVVTIDGRRVEACREEVRDGMIIETEALK